MEGKIPKTWRRLKEQIRSEGLLYPGERKVRWQRNHFISSIASKINKLRSLIPILPYNPILIFHLPLTWYFVVDLIHSLRKSNYCAKCSTLPTCVLESKSIYRNAQQTKTRKHRLDVWIFGNISIMLGLSFKTPAYNKEMQHSLFLHIMD